MCSVCGLDVLRLDIHLQCQNGFMKRSDSEEYKKARVDRKLLDPATKTGRVTELDAIMDIFLRFLMLIPGGDKKEAVTRTIQKDVHRIVETGSTVSPGEFQ